jgi:hypothetical protein
VLDGTPRNRSNEFLGGTYQLKSGISEWARIKNGSKLNGTEKEL